MLLPIKIYWSESTATLSFTGLHRLDICMKTVQILDEQHKRLKLAAVEENIALTALIDRAIGQYLSIPCKPGSPVSSAKPESPGSGKKPTPFEIMRAANAKRSEQMAKAQQINPQEAWRALPDTHARIISKGAWKPYPYLRLIGDDESLENGTGDFLHGEHDDIIDTVSVASMNMTRTAAAPRINTFQSLQDLSLAGTGVKSRVLVCPDELLS
jgi:hypothetical protein